MRLEIAMDNIVMVCEVHSYVKIEPNFDSTASDIDYCGYEELEFTVESALELDEDGLPFDLSSTEIDKLMADEWFVKLVEKELIKNIEKEND